MRAYSGIICPVLMGFSALVIVTLATTEAAKQPLLGFLAIPAFSLTVGLLLYAMQYGAIALMYTASPADHLDWVPEAKEEGEALEERKQEQRNDLGMRVRYEGRTGILYDLGLIAFLFGCFCLVVPRDVDGGRIAAALIFVVATLLEVAWTIATHTGTVLEWLVPTQPRRPRPPSGPAGPAGPVPESLMRVAKPHVAGTKPSGGDPDTSGLDPPPLRRTS